MAGWSNVASRPVATGSMGLAGASDGKIYALGGSIGDDIFPTRGTLAHHAYDPVTNTWTTKASYPVVIDPTSYPDQGWVRGLYLNAGAYNYAFQGGEVYINGWSTNNYRYDIAANTWLARTAIPFNDRALDDVDAKVAWDGADAIYILTAPLTGQPARTQYKYNLAANTYTSIGTFAGTFQGLGGKSVFFANKIFMNSGYYDLTTNTFTQYASSSSGQLVGMYSGKLYFEGTAYYYPAAERGRITGMRDPATAPYDFVTVDYSTSGTFSPVTPGRSSPPAAASVQPGNKVIAGQYYYLVCGWDSSNVRVNRVDRYDLTFPNTPNSLLPAGGATVNNDLATLSLNIVSNGELATPEWEVARDAAFTVDRRLVKPTTVDIFGLEYIPSTSAVVSGVVAKKLAAGISSELYQGTWYIRGRASSGLDKTPWTTTQSFVVSHPPALSLSSPIAAVALDWGATGAMMFQWAFSDTSETDYQTAYQLIVERVDTGAVLLDTAKVASQTARSYAWSVPSAVKDLSLRWKMRAWDSDDIAGPYTSYQTFSSSDLPTVNITAPAEGSTVATGKPTVTWTFAASGGRTQAKYQVHFLNNSNTVIFDSGVLLGNALTYTPPEQAISIGNFKVRVYARDGGDLIGTDLNNFASNYDTPAEPAFAVSVGVYGTDGYVNVAWTNAQKDAAFYSWRVYRRQVGVSSWTLLHESTDAVSTAFNYRDYSAGSGVAYQYIVVQAAMRFDATIESMKTNPQTVTATSGQYWLVDPADESNNMLLRSVTDESFTDEWESETMKVIGRGNHVDLGTRFGYTGSLTAKLRGTDARVQRLKLELLKSSQTMLLLRNPFGDVWQVSMGNLQIARISGTGTDEHVDVTIPYEEVS